MRNEPEIYCPKCEYHPVAEEPVGVCAKLRYYMAYVLDRWRCPGCGYQWLKTQCLACGEVSLHKEWYHYPDRHPDVEQERVLETTGT